MQVTLKLFASLSRYLPEGARRNIIKLEIDENTSIWDLLDRYNVPRGSCHLVLVNGVFHAPEVRGTVMLTEGDELAVWPPVAGG